MTTTIAVPAGGAYFEGHFPGRPILPAVGQLTLVLAAWERETGRPPLLSAIALLRLRQPVLPGDQLEFSARRLDGERVRFDLRRGGLLITNGELAFGSPHAPSNAFAPPLAAPAPSALPLDELLPHRPPMRFVTKIIAEHEDGLTCAARIPPACALVSEGAAPALAALEAAAQTAAAWEAVRRARKGGDAAPRVGYLVGMREVSLFAQRIAADEALVASIRLEAAALPLTHYAVSVSRGATPILQGKIATYLPQDGV